jgi:hypothetical protein
MRLQTAIGYKFFKDLGDEVEIIRLVKARKYKDGALPAEVTIEDVDGNQKKIRCEELEKEWTPLEPDGFATFNIVTMRSKPENTRDVIVTASKYLNVKLGDTVPFVICRQSILDFFNNLVVSTVDEQDAIFGISVNQNTCPSNFSFPQLTACDSVDYTDTVHFYREDTVEDILKMVNVSKFDDVLQDIYDKACQADLDRGWGDPSIFLKTLYRGWCSKLSVLLNTNNFQADINEMLGIADIDFDITEYIEKKVLPTNEEVEYDTVSDNLKLWLSNVYQTNIKDITVLKYDHDINLAEFNNARYFFIRNTDKQLYMLVYTIEGEYKEADMEAEMNKVDFSDKFRLKFYDKYSTVVN